MCRYSWHNYRDHFACFVCRKAFKQWQWKACDEDTFRTKQRLKHVPRKIVCPVCAKPMTDMGLDFKAPRKNNVEAWAILEILARNGYRFWGCGCSVGFTPPSTLREVSEWLSKRHDRSKGEELLNKFDRNIKAKARNQKPKPEPKARSLPAK